MEIRYQTICVFFTFVFISVNMAAELTSKVCEVIAYDEYGLMGASQVFDSYNSDLSTVDFDDTICSVNITGFWLFYENIDYNPSASGSVLWIHGLDYVTSFPVNNCDTTSSLRFAGNSQSLNENSFILYDGIAFTGEDRYGTTDSTNLLHFNNRTSSLILTGVQPWTFFTGTDYMGTSFCYFPNTDYDVSDDGHTVLNFGVFPSLQGGSVPDNSFQSARLGCFTSLRVYSSKLQPVSTTRNGQWGVVHL